MAAKEQKHLESGNVQQPQAFAVKLGFDANRDHV